MRHPLVGKDGNVMRALQLNAFVRMQPALQVRNDLTGRLRFVRRQDLWLDLIPVEPIVPAVLRRQPHVSFEMITCIVGTTDLLVTLLPLFLQRAWKLSLLLRSMATHVAFEVFASQESSRTWPAILKYYVAPMLLAVRLGSAWNYTIRKKVELVALYDHLDATKGPHCVTCGSSLAALGCSFRHATRPCSPRTSREPA